MAYEPVDVVIASPAPGSSPVANVIVRVFSADGATPFGETLTDADGRASFLLPAPATYQVRFYKFQVVFQQPLLLAVTTPGPNVFDVPATPYVHPQSNDNRLCLASGFFRRPDGSVASNVDMQFHNTFDPLLLDGSAVLTSKVATRTDERGYASVSLIRHGHYDVTVEGLEDQQRCVVVPDCAWVNLPDLIFPVVSAVVFDEPGPYEVAVDGTLTLTPHVFSTDLRELQLTTDVSWFLAEGDSSFAELDVGATTLTVRGKRPGVVLLRAQRLDVSIVRIPDLPISGVPLSITVV